MVSVIVDQAMGAESRQKGAWWIRRGTGTPVWPPAVLGEYNLIGLDEGGLYQVREGDGGEGDPEGPHVQPR
jgi:hypothetical protein